MDQLNQVYARLTVRQKNVFKAYLGLFQRNSKGPDRYLQFLDLLDRQPDLGPKEASLQLYGTKGAKAYFMLRKRLYERLMEFLATSLNSQLEKQDREMPGHYYQIQYRKQMLQAQILQEMGLGGLALDHLHDAREYATQAVAPELQVDALLRIRGNFRTEVEHLADLDADLVQSREAAGSDHHALSIYHSFVRQHFLRTAGTEARIDFLLSEIPPLEARIRSHPTVRGDYYLQMLKIQLAHSLHDYEMGRQAARRAIRLMEEHPGMRNPQRRAEPFVQWGVTELSDEQFGQAIEALQTGRAFLKNNSAGYRSATIPLCYALFHHGKLTEMHAELDALESNNQRAQVQASESLQAVQTFLRIGADFQTGNYRAAWQSLDEVRELYADQTGWGSGLRSLEIMLLVEMGEREWAESRLEPYRKHLQKYGAETREQAVYRLLAHAGRHFFYEEPIDQAYEYLQALEQIGWESLGHELIRVDRWYRRRLEARKAGG